MLIEDIQEPVQGETKTKKKKTLKKRKTVKTSTPKNLVKLYKKKGDIALKSFTEAELSLMIRYANKMYYCNKYGILKC